MFGNQLPTLEQFTDARFIEIARLLVFAVFHILKLFSIQIVLLWSKQMIIWRCNVRCLWIMRYSQFFSFSLARVGFATTTWFYYDGKELLCDWPNRTFFLDCFPQFDQLLTMLVGHFACWKELKIDHTTDITPKAQQYLNQCSPPFDSVFPPSCACFHVLPSIFHHKSRADPKTLRCGSIEAKKLLLPYGPLGFIHSTDSAPMYRASKCTQPFSNNETQLICSRLIHTVFPFWKSYKIIWRIWSYSLSILNASNPSSIRLISNRTKKKFKNSPLGYNFPPYCSKEISLSEHNFFVLIRSTHFLPLYFCRWTSRIPCKQLCIVGQ